MSASQLWLAQPPLIRLQQAGLIAILSGNYSLTEIIEIGDALLAAPVLALEIDLANRHAYEAITNLRQRAGPHLLIGASGVQTIEQSALARNAGAQFTAAATFDPVFAADSRQNNYLHISTISALTEAQRAAVSGCYLVKVDVSPECLAEFHGLLPDLAFIATGDITMDNITPYAKAGAVGVAAGRTLIADPYTSMATIISTARALQRTWAQAESYRAGEMDV